MSKRELETGELDRRFLFGLVTAVSVVGALGVLLVRHKQKSDEERLAELDERNEVRVSLLTQKIEKLENQHQLTTDDELRSKFQELIAQAIELRRVYETEAVLPVKIRVILEKLREAEAEVKDVTILREAELEGEKS